MNKVTIANNARTLLYEVWSERKLLWPFGVPKPVSMLDPRMISRMLGLEYEVREHLNFDNTGGRGNAVAGILNWDQGTITVSSQFNYHTQRFTAAHEIGHFVLHGNTPGIRMHRDRPVSDGSLINRPLVEREADYFAACLLMPPKLLEEEFSVRFGTRKPLARTETVAYHLHEKNIGNLFSAPHNSLAFASAVARAQSFDRNRFIPLSDHFGVSAKAMAIRISEIGLVAD